MSNERQKRVRNFCIIAHIDHGKSTLADRMLELTGALTEREMDEQVLDNMDIERERGITIKAQAVRMIYKGEDGEEYILNLIDTPGHVDFNYEVSRSIAACEGAILVVDASQGIEAQTLANVYLALEHDLEIVPVINKIDLPGARPEEIIREIEDVIGLEAQGAPQISAKNGINIDSVLNKIISDIPAPKGDEDAPLRALIFDSVYDTYKGVIAYIRVMEGKVAPGQTIRMMHTGKEYIVTELGYLRPEDRSLRFSHGRRGGLYMRQYQGCSQLSCGDTITLASNPASEPLPGYKKAVPMVFAGYTLQMGQNTMT